MDPVAETILVVDDDAHGREALGELLTNCGFNVAYAENGLAALDQIRIWGMPPALILLDLFMPVMDGQGFLRRARDDRRIKKVPIVVTTADRRPQPSGADAILTKPLNLEILLHTVRRFVQPASISLNGGGN